MQLTFLFVAHATTWNLAIKKGQVFPLRRTVEKNIR